MNETLKGSPFIKHRFLLYITRGGPYLIFLFAALFFLRDTPAWFLSENLGAGDWDAQTFYLEAARLTLLEYGQAPLWNPWYVGGLPVLENPQSKFFSPTFLIALFTKAPRALQFSIVFYYLLGFLSACYLFISVLGVRTGPALLGSGVFLYSSYLPLHLYAGHVTFIGYTLVPLALAAAIRAIQAREEKAKFFTSAVLLPVLISALVLSIIYAEGYHIALYLLPAGLGAALLYGLQNRSFGPLWIFLSVFCIFALFSAYRLLPQFEFFLTSGAGFFKDSSYLSLQGLWEIFTLATDNPLAIRRPEQAYFWWEYGAYIGVLPVYTLLAFSVFSRKQDWPLPLLIIGVLTFMAGHFAVFAPVKLLSQIPLYAHIRCYARLGFLVLFMGGIWLALLADRFLTYLAGRRELKGRLAALGFALIWLLTLATLYEMNKKNTPIFRKIFTLSPPVAREGREVRTPSPEKKKVPEEFRTISALKPYGANSAMYPALQKNYSTRDGYEILRSNRKLPALGEATYKGEAWLERGGDSNEVRADVWSPHKLEFRLKLKQPAILRINRNYYPGWRVNSPYKIESEKGLMLIRLKAGESLLRIKYSRPFYQTLLWVCLILQIGAIVFILYVYLPVSSRMSSL